MTRSKLFNREYAKELFRIAEGDLDSAQVLFRGQTKRSENIYYLAEQAIEKCLKAVICHVGQPIPITHSLSVLLFALPSSLNVPFGEEIDELTEFATVRRYEEGKAVLVAEEAQAALKLTEIVVEWARTVIFNQ
jgi:HEPN domain-containing protein